MARISHSGRIPKYTVAVHKLGDRAIGFVITGDDRIGDNLDHAELVAFFESLCAAMSREYDGDPEGLKRAILALVGGATSPTARQATAARLDLSNFNGAPRTPTAVDDSQEPIDPRALLRLKQVLKLIPVGASTSWEGVRRGKYPKPVKLGPMTTAWHAADILALLDSLID